MKKLMSLPSAITRSMFTRVTAFKRVRLILGAVVVVTVLSSIVFVVLAAQSVWNNTGTDYNSTGSWTGGVVPSGNNVAAFNVVEATQPNLSASVSISGLAFTTTGASGYSITRTSSAVFTFTGQTAGSAAQTTNSNSAAIFSATTSGTNTVNVPITLAPASGTTSTFNQASGGTLIVDGVISGSGITLSLPGLGTVQLNGTNTFSGGTTLSSAGSLQIGNDSGLGTGTFIGSSTGTVSASGGARTIANNVTWSGNGTVGGGNDLTINGTFTSSGAASRSLTANNSGMTTLAGSVFLAPDNTTARGLTIAGTGPVTISGVIANNNAGNTLASAFTLNSSGTLTLSNANTYTGTTSLSAGTLIVGNKSAFGTGTVSWNGVTTSASTDLSGANAIANAGTIGATGNIFNGSNNLELSGVLTNSVSANTITNNISGGTFTLSNTLNLSNASTNRTVTFDGTGNTAITGVIANGSTSTSNLAKSGAGTLTLSNTNTYSGTTAINAGTLALTGTGSFASTSSITVAGGATFDVSGRTSTLTLGNSQTLNGTGTASSGTINASPTVGLTMGTTSPLTLTYASGNPTLNVTGGALTLQSGNPVTVSTTSALPVGSYVLISKTGTGSVAGTAPTSVTITGSGLAGGATASLAIIGQQLVLVVAAPDVTFNASGSLAAGTYNNVTINNCGTFVTMTGNVTINGTLTINSCAHLLTETFFVSGPGSFVLNADGWLHIGSPNGITTSPTLSGNIQVTGGRAYSTAGNYVYTGIVNQAVGNGLPGTVANLLISNTGPGGNNTVTGNAGQIVTVLLEMVAGVYLSASDYVDVQIDAGATLSLAANITVSGNWTNNGTFTPNGFSVTFDGTGAQLITTGGTGAGKVFAGFAVNKTSGTATLAGDMKSTTLDITAGGFDQGATFSVEAGPVTVGATGVWTNTGTGDLELLGGVTNSGSITFNGNGAACGQADAIDISASTQQPWSGAGTFSMTDVTVFNQGGTAPIVVRSGSDSGGNGLNWLFVPNCTGGAYTWNNLVSGDWAVPANWTPARVTPDPGDVLYFTPATPAPTVTNVAGALGETIAELHIQSGSAPSFSTTGARTLTIDAGALILGFDVDTLAVVGPNPLRIELGAGTLGEVDFLMSVAGSGHRLISNTPNAITFPFFSLFTTSTGFTGNPFGTGGAGEGAAGSVHFQSFSTYTHNAGLSPFGASGNPSVVVFETGSEARYFTASGFDASGRTYSILTIGSIGGGGIEVDASQSGTGNFQFDELNVRSPDTSISTLTYNGSGSSTITIKGSIFSDGNVADTTTNDTTLVAGTGGIVIDGGVIQELCGTSDRPATFGSNAVVTNSSTFELERNLIVSPSTSVLTINPGSTLTGGPSPDGWVIGNLRKTLSAGTNTFEVGTANGYSPLTLVTTTLIGTPTFTTSATNSYMTGITDTSRAIQRFWTLSTTAPVGDLVANLTFQYVPGAPAAGDESVNVDRNTLNVFRRNGNGSINDLGATSRVTTTSPPPSVTVNGVNAFSDWTLANGGSVITYARLRSFEAISTNGGNVVQWHTSYEVDNLGFNLYRLKAGKLVRVTPSLVAGSALMAGPKTTMTAGMSYSWRDPKGQPDSEYYLEDVELNGSRTMNGPIVPVAVEKSNLTIEKQAALLSELNQLDSGSRATVTGRPAAQRLAPESIRAVPTGKPNGSTTDRMSIVQDDPLAKQRALAGGSAVKMSIRQTGWYHVTQTELVAAGLSPNVDPTLLQLYVDGREQPILVQTGQNGADAAIEFYGTGMDTATADARTYWLVAGSQPGRRINVEGSNSSANAQNLKDEGISMTQELPLTSYGYTVERKDRTIYFASLLNGDAENFFGAVITNTPTVQNLSLSNIDHTVSGPGTLEVALQGGTAKPHQVKVLFNGIEMGVMNFNGQEHPVQQFQIPRPYLVDGNNSVTLEALGGDSDVSVVDFIRLTYYHTYRAENDSLLFSTEHKTTVVDGFTNPRIRVFDVTNADAIAQLPAKVSPSGSGYAVKIPGGKGTMRVLLALTDAQMLHPAGIAANESSNLSDTENRADFIILTHRDFRDAVAPLAAMRRNQGLETMVVTVEDVYDEFSYGAPSRDAIKAFFAWTRSNWASGPRYVLLVGDASADPRNYLKTGRGDFVPTRLIDTKLLETASDDALVDFNNDGLAEISIGRLPAQTLEQAQKMIGKITSYVPGQSSAGALLVSDHYEGYDFETANDRIRALLPTNMPVGIVNRRERGTAQVRGEIIAGINQGPMIVNYLGHGSVEVWTGSGILRSADTPLLTNGQRTPFFVTMTCLNGYFQDVYTESLAEALMKADNGGAVAVWASSGLTEPEGQALMDQQLMRLLFGAEQSQPIGDAVRGAKAATTDMDVRKTWILFGDPTMRLR